MRTSSRLSLLGLLFVVATGLGGACRKQKPQRSGHAPAVVIQSPDAGVASSITEREPNDSMAQAEDLGVGPIWRIHGALGDPIQGSDIDTFQLTIPPGGSQFFEVLDADGGVDQRTTRLSLSIRAGAASNLILQVLDEREQAVASLSCIRGTETMVPNIAVVPNGRYFLRVKATRKLKPATGMDADTADLTYNITAEAGQFGPGDEREPNDNAASAEAIKPFAGTIEVAGYLSQNRDEDWYRIPLPTLPSALGVEVGPVEGVAIRLKIVEEGGTKLTGAVGQTGLKVLLQNVRIPSQSSDAGADLNAVFLVVSAEAGKNQEDRYVLRLNLGPVESEMEVEPNDSPGQSTLIAEGTTRGYLSRGDVDFFRMLGHANQAIEVRVVPPPRVRLIMEINRLSDGQLIGRKEAKKLHDSLNLTMAPTTEDSFLIRLSPRKGDGNPNQPYSLSLSAISPSIPAFPAKPTP